jgi:hypothetical protein
VDEQAWLSCDDPQRMLTFLRDTGKLSERKARLFAVACCRRIWHLFHHQDVLNGVEVVERFADGQTNLEDLRETDELAMWAGDDATYHSMQEAAAAWAVAEAAHREGFAAATGVLHEVHSVFAEAEAEGRVERVAQAALLRDLFGNPFRPVPLAPSVLRWNGGTVKHLAEEAYEEREWPSGQLDPQRLGVLADALEEAGADAELVAHLREALHWRGCFVLDLLLGKE